MGIRYPGRAQIDPMAPQALGICDRCGFQYNLRALTWQYAWAGRELINKRILVCDTCMDVPNEQLRTIRLPPDPYPIYDVRPENFAVDEKNFLTLQKVIGWPYMFYPAVSSMTASLGQDFGIIALLDGVSDFDGVLQYNASLVASLDGVSDFDVNLLFGVGLTALLDGVSDLDAELTQVVAAGLSRVWTDSFFADFAVPPFTETGAAIGTAAADRQVFVGFMGSMDFTDAITSVTIGGIPAKRVVVNRGRGFAFGVVEAIIYSEVWWAPVPTGTTADIVVNTVDSGALACIGEVYAVYGADASLPVWVSNDAWAASGSVSANLDIPAASVTLGFAFTGFSSAPTTSSWTNLTEDSDQSLLSGFGDYTNGGAASRADTGAPGSVSISATAASADDLPQKMLGLVTITADPGNKWIVLTAGSSFSVPADWNNADNSVHAFGASPNASNPAANNGGGGTGGGAWARTDNLVLTPSGSATYQIGVPGTPDTWLSNTGVTPVSTATGVLAKGGSTNSNATGGQGGQAASCIGHAANNGGNGGNSAAAANSAGGGGGGAGGPFGAGGNGGTGVSGNTAGGGGGSADGGSAGGNGSGTTSGAGGTSRMGVPTTDSGLGGEPGLYGSGGTGKGGASPGPATGSMEQIFIDDATGALAGPGSGGGGGRGGGATGVDAAGGQGGLYGGGAGGTGEDGATDAAGRNGLIVIRYRP